MNLCSVVQGQIRLTGFYGAPEESDRRFAWELLRLLSDGHQGGWFIFRDFNEIL